MFSRVILWLIPNWESIEERSLLLSSITLIYRLVTDDAKGPVNVPEPNATPPVEGEEPKDAV